MTSADFAWHPSTLAGRCTATVVCPRCAFRAQHTDDTVLEVITFLSQRLLAHAVDMHGLDQMVARAIGEYPS